MYLLNAFHIVIPRVARYVDVLQRFSIRVQRLNEVLETTVRLVWVDAVGHVQALERFHLLEDFEKLLHTVDAKVIAGGFKLD